MPINTAAHRAPSAGRARLPILIAAWLLIAATALIGSGLPETAHAQAIRGAIPSPTLASNVPGQFVITWATPDPTPTDYRIRWANTDLGFPSYSAANEPERGNEYPLGDINTLTLSNLTPGDSYKIQIRSRYYNADRSVHESSGPWTATATIRVMDEPAEPPQSDDQERTVTPTPMPMDENDDPPPAPTGLTVSRVGHSVLTLTWDDPEDDSITGYRVLRGPDADSLSTLSNTQSDSTSFTDSTVEPDTSYHYAVVALSQDGNSVQSSTLSATTPAAPKSKDPPPQRVGPRQATITNVWTATLTPVDVGGNHIGCNSDNDDDAQRCSTATILSDDDFEHDSTDYTIVGLFLGNGTLTLGLDTNITPATSTLTLVVGTTSFDITNTNSNVRTWTNSGLTWTIGTDVSVKLTESSTTPPIVTKAQTSATGGQIQLGFSKNPKTSNLPPHLCL